MIALQHFVNSLAQFLAEQAATPLTTVGAVRPNVVAELPAITLSMAELSCGKAGVGGAPRNLVTGVMEMALTLDLANPVVRFPDETVNLLGTDRLTVQIPHQPLVDRNGSSPAFLSPGDVSATLDGTAMTVVAVPPGNGQCRLHTATGIMEFGAALPAAGRLVIVYRIGQWEVETTRCSGQLQIEIFATGAEPAGQLSNEVSLALARSPQTILQGLTRLSPIFWGAIEKAGTPKGNTMLRILRYTFTFDHEQPVISTGGGPIRIIDVGSTMGPEQFLITKRDNHE